MDVTVKLPNVKPVRKANGRVYWYHRRPGSGALTPLPGQPGEAAFMARYAELQPDRPARAPAPEGSTGALVKAYRKAPEFTGKAAKTRTDYGRYLDDIEATFGDVPVADWDAEAVLELRDAFAAQPRKADYMVQVLSILFSYAIPRRRTYGLAANPCFRIGRLHDAGDGYLPWPAALIAAFRDPAHRAIVSEELCWVMEAGLGTGQRGQDLVVMAWSHDLGDAIEVAQQKGGARVVIPKTAAWRGALRRVKRRATVILTRPDGQAWKLDHLRHEIQAAVAALGYPGYTMHGWRKNATVELVEAGCSDAEARSITGHKTDSMLRHYARAARQKTLAAAAVAKLDKRRKPERNKRTGGNRVETGKPNSG